MIKKMLDINNQTVGEMLHSNNLSDNRSPNTVETFNSTAWNLLSNESRKQHYNVIDFNFPLNEALALPSAPAHF